MFNPVSTYRIQFHKDFTFSDLEKIIPYLQKLGIQTLYASPVLEATPGSTHGYDGVNPDRINPEIGTEEQLRTVSGKLKAEGIQWLQDIVPNHMAYHANNPWLMDVLEKGRRSAYGSFFDILWESPVYHGRIMVPFLGSTLEESVKKGEIRISWQQQKLKISYYDNSYPLAPWSYISILKSSHELPHPLQSLLREIEELQSLNEESAYRSRWDEVIRQLVSWTDQQEGRTYLEERLREINNDREKLLQIAEEQVYRLCHWQETDQKINFRRFFTINGLICLNIQDQKVFDTYHRFTKALLEEGIFRGLRIDHIDGLYDPEAYLDQLREMAGEETYIVVEKILEPGEDLPRTWNIQGNTGYDFLALVNNLLTSGDNEEVFTKFYQKLTGDKTSVHQQIRDKKAYILYNHMEGELENLLRLFLDLKLTDEKVISNLGHNMLKQAIAELLIQCPVYRFYGNRLPLARREAKAVKEILDRIRESRTELVPAMNLLEQVLLQKPKEGNKDYNERALRFYMRCMQFTGPLMAKGVEDTLMYTYSRFIGHNEVGDSPEAFGITPEEFHAHMEDRQQYWPMSLNATATHDTKRGEDVSARLNVLTDLGEEWLELVQQWQQQHQSLKQDNAPDTNDEYFIYQTLAGTHPMPGEHDEHFSSRLREYLTKALREAKRHSNWTTPNAAYEEAAGEFAQSLLDPQQPFKKSFDAFHRKISDYGIVNSLSKVLLKYTCPGIPDTYQGTELWDLSMVDPDNRRPVDYEKRISILDRISSAAAGEDFLKQLWEQRYDGSVKLWLIHTLLKERRDHQALFTEGHYYPLKVKGKYKAHVMAYARRHQQHWYIAVLPLHLAALCEEQGADILSLDWKNTRVVLPEEAPESWEHLLLQTKGRAEEGIAVKDLFRGLPLAILKLQESVTDRSAGILMHISSLPAPFGVGDLGPQARIFADFLSRSKQKYWQLLPLNPTELGNGHSPYSSISSMAGNTILISPELLEQEGLLTKDDFASFYLPEKSEANFREAERIKHILFEKAFRAFQQGRSAPLKHQYQLFCQQEAYWLDDFALYVVLKHHHEGKAWFQWPEEYKLRRPEALQEFARNQADLIGKTKWLQFVFSRQWKGLKTYCNNLGIQTFGDLPFYVSYDSADVWSNPDIFSLDREGNITGVAGVPPDYFNSDGQLWGMPVFRWDVLKARGYDWWIQRIKKNMELFDVVRLDHFRAFADYWEVPAGEKTAKKGTWKPGPGSDFFRAIQQALGTLPFIAEDLGDINELVHQLRDEFSLPGMKVLQFAFGDDIPGSIYIPHNYNHNYVAYTGTHDNNTTVGWFRENTGKTERNNIERYTGLKAKEKNIHEILGRLAYSSVAKTAILPMQDVLGLDESARMNIPASTDKNWLWRMKPGQLKTAHEAQLREWVKLYNR